MDYIGNITKKKHGLYQVQRFIAKTKQFHLVVQRNVANILMDFSSSQWFSATNAQLIQFRKSFHVFPFVIESVVVAKAVTCRIYMNFLSSLTASVKVATPRHNFIAELLYFR